MTNGVGSTSDINTFDHNLNWSSAGGKDLSSDMIDSSDSEWLCQLSQKKTQKHLKIKVKNLEQDHPQNQAIWLVSGP